MNIGIVTQAYYPIKGGVTEHVHATAEELRKRGHTVTIITAYFNRGDEEWNDGVERIGRDLTLPFNGAFVNLTVGFRLCSDLRRLEQQYRFDVVHIHSPLDPVLGIVAMLNIAAPKVGTFHTYKPTSIGFRLFRGPLERRCNRRLAVRIAVSEAARNFYSRYFQGDWEIVPNGVDIRRFNPSVPPLPELTDGKKNILFVGRMDPRKGVNLLLDAFARIADDAPDTRLVIVGGGVLVHHYRRFVPQWLKDRVAFTYYVSTEQLPRFFASADVCCFPASGRESFGIVLAEAMAAGKAIVASDILGYRGVLDDGTQGFLAEQGNASSLAGKLMLLLKDKSLRERMGRAGREKAETRYSWAAIVDDLERLYRRAIEGSS